MPPGPQSQVGPRGLLECGHRVGTSGHPRRQAVHPPQRLALLLRHQGTLSAEECHAQPPPRPAATHDDRPSSRMPCPRCPTRQPDAGGGGTLSADRRAACKPLAVPADTHVGQGLPPLLPSPKAALHLLARPLACLGGPPRYATPPCPRCLTRQQDAATGGRSVPQSRDHHHVRAGAARRVLLHGTGCRGT